MTEYHKIQTVFKRDPNTKFKTLLMNDYSLQEFEYLANNTWIFTEKVDGTNIRVIWDGNTITLGGRKEKSQIPVELVNTLHNQFDESAIKVLQTIGNDVIIYGEGYGSNIQKVGHLYHPNAKFVVFDIKINGYWLDRENVEDVANKLGLDVVPIIGSGTLYNLVNFVRNGIQSTWGNFDSEGIVARPKIELYTKTGHRIITKLKTRDFQ